MGDIPLRPGTSCACGDGIPVPKRANRTRPHRSVPDGVERQTLYEPTANGHERRIRERLEYWEGLRARKR